jgi:hypothetical protein
LSNGSGTITRSRQHGPFFVRPVRALLRLFHPDMTDEGTNERRMTMNLDGYDVAEHGLQDGQALPAYLTKDRYPENRHAVVPVDVARALYNPNSSRVINTYIAVDARQTIHPNKWTTIEHVTRYMPGLSREQVRLGMRDCEAAGVMEVQQFSDKDGVALRARVIVNLGRKQYETHDLPAGKVAKKRAKGKVEKDTAGKIVHDPQPQCLALKPDRQQCNNRKAVEHESLCKAHARQAQNPEIVAGTHLLAHAGTADGQNHEIGGTHLLAHAGGHDAKQAGASPPNRRPSQVPACSLTRGLTTEKRLRRDEAEPKTGEDVTKSCSAGAGNVAGGTAELHGTEHQDQQGHGQSVDSLTYEYLDAIDTVDAAVKVIDQTPTVSDVVPPSEPTILAVASQRGTRTIAWYRRHCKDCERLNDECACAI